MFCEQCGYKNPDDSMFCENCGARFDGSGGAPVNPAATPPPPVQLQQAPPPPVQSQQMSPQHQMPPRQPQYQQPYTGQGGNRNVQQNKKSPLPVIIIAIAAVLVIICIIVAAVLIVGKLKKTKGADTSSTEMSSIPYEDMDDYDTEETENMPDDISASESDDTMKDSSEDGEVFEDERSANDDSDPFPEEDPDEDFGDDSLDGEASLDEDSGNTGNSDLLAHAKEMSTDEDAYATEFDWFIDIILNDGTMNGQVVTDKSQVMQIYKDAEVLNGGWKCFMCGQKKEYFNSPERYMHANIDTDGDNFELRLDWGYFIPNDGSEGNKEEGSYTFNGKWDPEMGTVNVSSDSGNVDIQCFYESTDNGEQYAFGTMTWPSGEVDNIAFMRGPRGY